MNIVFDVSALIAYIRNEPGSDIVDQHLRLAEGQSWVHALNLCEVYYDFYRAYGQASAEQTIQGLAAAKIIERQDMDAAFWREVGRLKAVHRRVSLADCCAVALTQRLDGILVSADRHEMEHLMTKFVCPIVLIR